MSDTWASTSMTAAAAARVNHSAVWAGRQMIVWGGHDDAYRELNTGARYDPALDRWTPTATTGAPFARDSHTAVWTGSLMLVWGGWPNLATGGRYIVLDAAVDHDGDGYSACQGDCDDGNPAVHPAAVEMCNGIDDDCDVVVDNGGNSLCDDGNPCTDDSCQGASGCRNVNNTTPCDDHNVCTTGDVCGDGTCHGTPADGIPCDDGSVCTTNDTCHGGACHGYPSLICDDNNPCNGIETCNAQTGCVAGTPVVCNDNNPCTDDSCDPATGLCVSMNDDANPCNDGNPCTQTDRCQAGICNGSNPVLCNIGCPTGFIQVGGLCQKTYDISESLLDNLSTFCDGTGTNRYNNCYYLNYGFHWSDLGGSLAAVTRVDVQFETGINCGGTSSGVNLNGVPVGSFNLVGSCLCSSAHGTVSLSNVAAGAYVRAGVNTISVTPSGSCEGLTKSASLANNFARVTVTYSPHSGACYVGTCEPATGACNASPLQDGTPCNDDNACTEGDVCGGGVCNGTPITATPETQNVAAAADKATYSWSAVTSASQYDVVRGSTGAFPVGPGGGDEVCFDNLANATLVDATVPAPGDGFWYLSRAENACGVGTLGTQGLHGAPGAPRVTTTCP